VATIAAMEGEVLLLDQMLVLVLFALWLMIMRKTIGEKGH